MARPVPAAEQLDPLEVLNDRAAAARPAFRATRADRPGATGPGTVTITAVGSGDPVTVHYTLDGSIPTTRSASFAGSADFDISDKTTVVACYARDDDGSQNYQAFPLTVRS